MKEGIILTKVPAVTLNNDILIPQLGLGVFKMQDKKQFMAAFNWALEIGYRHFDTAAIYGNEKWLGEAINNAEIDRQDLFLTSKLWPSDFDDPQQAYQDSCKRLGVDYLDLYLIHWPAPGYAKAWITMEEMYHDEQIRAIGVSNFLPSHLQDILTRGSVTPAVDQIELHPYYQRPELTNYLAEQNIAVEAWGPLGQGSNDLSTEPVLQKIAAAHHKSIAQVVLRWHIQSGRIIFPKSVHQNRLQENFDIFDFELTAEQMQQIKQLDKNQPNGHDPSDQAYLNETKTIYPKN
ncbi:aldo/keto reductase [Bombilactobacillus thymidiniphilus]|uniref:Aldo/keto reductase n=1 Tax=Bombilactobacillus thymidiniphilus TaxID=2923363 RepID=A0ABY4PBZ3_9LACO|nr:aldo/keto reductase [Bombilactobacillus thymidiniphilus]UQS83183.1 aldo/keto reductase [Bombilactobacillus thymidiniphilus]